MFAIGAILCRLASQLKMPRPDAYDSGADPLGLPGDRRLGPVKSFAFEICNRERVGVSLPTQLRRRQWVMGSVAHVLRWPTEERAYFSSWSATSVMRLASMRDEPDGALAWTCPAAAELAQQQDTLRRQLQHLAQVLQGMRGLVCFAPLIQPRDPAAMPPTGHRSQNIRSGARLIRSKSQLFRSSIDVIDSHQCC